MIIWDNYIRSMKAKPGYRRLCWISVCLATVIFLFLFIERPGSKSVQSFLKNKTASVFTTLSQTGDILIYNKVKNKTVSVLNELAQSGDLEPEDVEDLIQHITEDSADFRPLTMSSLNPTPGKVHNVKQEVRTDTKLVLLLAYQRTGSTFLGDIFNMNKEMQYTYEPLDGIYTHLYGTMPNHGAPMDIHFHWNTQPRALPEYEQVLLRGTIEHIFTCDFSRLIDEQLINNFWIQFKSRQVSARQYAECLDSHKCYLKKCREHIESTCPMRIGRNITQQEYCQNQLSRLRQGKQTSGPDSLIQYHNCVSLAAQTARTVCVPHFEQRCKQKSIRVIKTVRLDAATIAPLMERYPGLKIVHQYRDPRPVVLSRITQTWSSAHGSVNKAKARKLMEHEKKHENSSEARVIKTFTKHRNISGVLDLSEADLEELLSHESPSDFAKEAKLYCYQVLQDKRVMAGLAQAFPSRVYEVIYEKVMDNPLPEVTNIYSFLEEELPSSVRKWAEKIQGSKVTEWKGDLAAKIVHDINQACSLLYDVTNYTFTDT